MNVLGYQDGEAFCARYDITRSGNFEGKNIPNLIGHDLADWDQEYFDHMRRILYVYRKERMVLHRDDKILTSWNALTIVALADAGFLLNEDRYLEAAKAAQQFIEQNLTDADNRLYIRWRDGEAAHAGQLEDYAFYVWALLALYETTFDVYYLEQAVLRAKQIEQYFSDRENGGYYQCAEDVTPLIARPKSCYDGAIPSGNSVTALVFGRLSKLTGEEYWRRLAQEQMAFLAGEMGQYPSGYGCGLMAMLETVYPGRELICVTDNHAVPEELIGWLRSNKYPNLRIMVKTAQSAPRLEQMAPLTVTYRAEDGKATYYLCENGTCSLPVTDIRQLKR